MRLKSSIKKSIKKYSIKRAVAHCVVGLFFKQDSKHTLSPRPEAMDVKEVDQA